MEDPNKLEIFFKLLYSLDWLYVPSNALSRVSIVALYLRIFNDKFYRKACWFVIIFLLGNMVAIMVSAQVECFPIEYIWDKSIEGGRCFNQVLWYQLANIPNVLADLMILVLPIPTVWGLSTTAERKAGIAAVFLLGSV